MRDVSTSFIATAFVQGANLANGILLARLLGVEGRGELAAVILWPSVIVALGGLAINDALIYHSSPRRDDPRQVYATGMAVALVQSLALALVGLAVVPLVYADYTPTVRWAAYLYLLFIPLSLFGQYATALLQGRLRIGQWNLLRVLGAAAPPLAIGAAALLGAIGVVAFAAATLAALAVGLVAAHAAVLRQGWGGWRPSGALAVRLLAFGLPIHAGVVATIANSHLDRMLISQWLAPEAFGLYVVAMALGSAVVMPAATLGHLAFPKLSAYGDDAAMAGIILGRYLRSALLISAGAAVVLAALAPWLIALLFGSEFAAAAPILRVLLVAMVAMAGKTILVQAFKAHGHTRVVAGAELVGLAGNVAALATLLPALGVVGAAWALLVSQGAVLVGLLAMVRGRLGLGAAELLRPRREDASAALRQVRALWR